MPEPVFQSVVELVPREDRDLDGQVFAGFGADRLRTAIARACKAAGVPAFSPHDLTAPESDALAPRRPPGRRGRVLARPLPQEHLKTYANATLGDRAELDYEALLLGGIGEMRVTS